MTNSIQKRQEILRKINSLCTTQDIKLIAVSKTFLSQDIIDLMQDGQIDFGENYLQEALEKIQFIKNQGYKPIWHFIGSIQSNKTNLIAQNFDWVHTVERQKIAKRLNDQRSIELGKLNICIQVNIDNSTTKAGINPSQVFELASYINSCQNLKLRGIMGMPDLIDGKVNIQAFKDLKNLYNELKKDFDVDTLCMGMSGDYIEAIENGANMVRIGSAIFGNRNN